ncbi:hypothetical protein HDV05_002291 [Chytridiales sp. JEL 0842]|nr:hypothetical protein HDV05_002291 [Chytridiales sp. JEL 0842]
MVDDTEAIQNHPRPSPDALNPHQGSADAASSFSINPQCSEKAKDLESGFLVNYSNLNNPPLPTATKIYLQGSSGSKRWIKYLFERVQLPVYILCNSGIVLSAFYLWTPAGAIPLEGWRFVWGVLSLCWLFLTLRLMDDHKDWETDVLAHPERPLPRGLLTPTEVRNCILLFLVPICLLNALLLGLVVNWQTGVTFLVATVFQVLMWVEFGIGHILDKNPFIYACMHQPVMLIYFSYSVGMFHDPNLILHPTTVLWGAGILGCTFAFEVSRKLDPLAHPALGTYLVAHTRTPTFLIIVAMNVLAGVAAYYTRVGILCWPFEGSLIAFAFLVLYGTKDATPPPYKLGGGGELTREQVIEQISKGERKPAKAYKHVELLATLSVLVHYYAVCFKVWGNGSVKV